MKRIIRITMESVEVPDDHVITVRNEEGEPTLILESDGHCYLGTQAGADFLFTSITPELNQISPVMQYLYWATIAWRGFLPFVPEALRKWMEMYLIGKDIPVAWAKEFMRKRLERVHEINTRQINFAKYDPDLFPPEEIWFSLN